MIYFVTFKRRDSVKLLMKSTIRLLTVSKDAAKFEVWILFERNIFKINQNSFIQIRNVNKLEFPTLELAGTLS